MAKSNIIAVIPFPLQAVWDVVTCVENYHKWRSDIVKAETSDEKHFVEIAKNNFTTFFTVTHTEKFKRWEFDMENENMKGHWTGRFSQKGDETEVDFSEEVTAKKFLLKPFVKGYLKKQQARFVSDLQEYCRTRPDFS